MLRLRPAPGRRTRSDTSTPAQISPTAVVTVERDKPDDRATNATPPRPNARANDPDTIRRDRSSRCGNITENATPNASSPSSTTTPYNARLIPAGTLTAVLHDRGVADHQAGLAADLGMTVLRTAMERWSSGADDRDLADVMHDTMAELRAVASGG